MAGTFRRWNNSISRFMALYYSRNLSDAVSGLIKNFLMLYYPAEKIAGEVKDMLCHLVIDLNKGLCTRSVTGRNLCRGKTNDRPHWILYFLF